MARKIERLTVGAVKAAMPKPDGKTKLYPDGAGLYLKVEAGADGSPNRSWVYRYSVDGRERWAGLGSLNDVTIADARKRRREMASIRATGQDPLDAKDTAREARRATKAAKETVKQEADTPSLTFDKAIDLAFESMRAKWTSERHADQWKDSLVKYASPVIGAKSCPEIDITDILSILRPLWQRVPETASRLRARIEHVLSHSFSVLHPDDPRAAQRLIDANPARRSSHLTFLLGAHDRTPEPFPALPYSDVANFVSELRADGGVDALALEFLILTASRVSTVLGAVWSEIDWQEAVWTIPREKMKNRKDDHDVPLGPRAVAILRAMEQIKSSDRIFPVSRTAMWRLLKAKHPDVSVHGFRSCFKDAASDILGADDELSELALHHTVGSKTRRSYRRGKALQRRRELMLWWESFCQTPYQSNVVLMAKTA